MKFGIKLKLNKSFFSALLSVFLVICVLCTGQVWAADNGNCSDYAWVEKGGFVSVNGSEASVDYGITVTDTGLSGYAWSEKLGWINFDDSGSLYAVTNDGSGNLGGYAWSEKGGYISFDDSGSLYAVTIDESGNFSGYAWSEKLGYINMDDSSSLYKVTTTWVPPSAPTVTNSDGATDITDNSARLNGNLTDDGNVTTTVYIYWGDDDGGTATTTWDSEVNLGEKSEGTFYTDISDLTSAKNYYYRCFAENSVGSDWSDETTQIRSLNISGPVIFKTGVILKKNVIVK